MSEAASSSGVVTPVRTTPVTGDDAFGGRESQPVEDGAGGDGRGLADDDLHLLAGAALNRADDGRGVGQAAGEGRAVAVAVGGDETGPGADSVEGDL